MAYSGALGLTHNACSGRIWFLCIAKNKC